VYLEEKSINESISAYYGDIFRYSLSLLRNYEDAQDAVQDVFIRFMQSSSTFRGECSIKTWLLVITRNYCLKKLSSKKSPHITADESLLAFYELNIETRITLNDALTKLSIDEYELIYLREYADYSYQEIAEILGINIDSVRMKLFRVRKVLKKYINEK
jgi:RNA polymerase sigma-70 factor (ECF subfamily)